MPQLWAIAFWNVARTSPTLPPSAIRTLAMSGVPRTRQHDSDVVEDRGDRRMRLVHGDLDRTDARKVRQDGIGHRAGRALQQLVIGVLESRGGRRNNVGVRHGVGEPVAARRFRQIGIELKVDDEALADFGLVLHHAVACMDRQAAHEDRIGHGLLSIACATRRACKVSATSWVRMIFAPRCEAIRCAAIEPASRSVGSDGDTEAMKRFREAPTRIGRPNMSNSRSRASAIMLCSAVLPKPMPGSSTILSRGMPAFAAISSERRKNAFMSTTISIAGSTLARLCMTMTGTPFAATVGAMPASPCRPQTSLAIAAPRSSAKATTSAFMLSIETGTPSATMSDSTGLSRASSSSAVTGRAPL